MKIYGAEGLDMVNPARRIAPVFALAAVLLAEPAVGASGSAGTAEGPESWEGAVIAAKEDFVLYYGDGLEVVDDPLAFEGQAVRQPCTSGSWGIQWKGCFPENTNPLRWYHLWVRMRADKKGDTGNAAAVGVFDPPRNFHPLSRAVTAAEMPVDEYRWIDAGHFRASKDCVVYISPVNNSENVEFFYVDRVAYAPDPEPGPHPEWVNSLKPRGEPGPELTLATQKQTDYTILLSAAPTTQDEKAAEDLSRWLGLMTDADFRVVREGGDYEPGGKEISIGRTALAVAADLAELNADLEGGGYAIAVRGETLYLLGGKARGIINAVYSLLEEDLGCRWYSSEARGQTIPHLPTLRFRPVPRVYVPVLADRRDPYYRIAQSGDWSLRNRTLCISTAIPGEWGDIPRPRSGSRTPSIVSSPVQSSPITLSTSRRSTAGECPDSCA